VIYWLTGLPSAGKTTIARALKRHLWMRYGESAVVLDADDIRQTVNAGLGFSDGDRLRNVANLAHMARAVHEGGGTAIVACIAPLASMRAEADRIMRGEASWVLLSCPEEERRKRDSRGLYAAHDRGEITGLTGVDAPYEPPILSEYVPTDLWDEEECVRWIALRPEVERAVFIGRWCPFHNGHKAIIDHALQQDKHPLILVRRTNEWPSVGERLSMIRYVYACDGRVKVLPVDDVESVCIGRQVGYAVVRYDMPEDVEGISGTTIRALIERGNEEWKRFVPGEVAEVIGDSRS